MTFGALVAFTKLSKTNILSYFTPYETKKKVFYV
jgi:hypothetical protein